MQRMMEGEMTAPNTSVQSVGNLADRIRREIGKAVVGQDQVVEMVLVALLADGHVLLEGVPGLAKTLLVRSFARTVSLDFNRIQFTPDLMPSDVIGTTLFDAQKGEFRVRKGPIFSAVLLADEINRTPPKTQSGLLEAMEERRATIDGTNYLLPYPFLVFATQNPLEYEGTYPLPEAQQDRFLLKVLLDYPLRDVEISVYQRHHGGFSSQSLDGAELEAVATEEDIRQMRAVVNQVTLEEKMFSYIYEIVSATRASHDLLAGASPRAGIALMKSSKALAALRGRNFVIPDDIKELALPVLRHRVILRPETEIEGGTVDETLRQIIDAQAVPR